MALFKWVPDGMYDHVKEMIRYQVVDGNPITTISNMWLVQGAPDHLSEEFKKPWGTYPDFPPKPAK